jgi:hypothetical protein
MNDPFEVLEKIQPVETPDFLFTRIQARIEKKLPIRISTTKTLLYLTAVILLVLVNVFSLKLNSKPAEKDVVSELNLTPDNQLYP